MKRRSYVLQRQAQRRTRRRGTVMYFVAGGLVMLLGAAALAVDYGVLVNDKNYLQRVCDAAALGGATKLPKTDGATNLALLVAGQNRFADDTNNDMTITFPDGNRHIRVEAVRRRRLFFARALGQSQGVVRAHAIAGSNANTPSIAPIGITTTTYDGENPESSPGGPRFYDTRRSPTFTIKLSDHKKEGFGIHEMVLFDLRDPNGKSPEHMSRQLAGTEPVNITPDDVVGAVDPPDATALNAKSQDNFLFDGMTERFQTAAGSPWLDIDPAQGTNYTNYVGQHFDEVFDKTEPIGDGNPFYDNPRVLSLIVTDETAGRTNGTLNAPVRDLAPVYVMRLYTVGADTFLDYRYLPGRNSASGAGFLLE